METAAFTWIFLENKFILSGRGSCVPHSKAYTEKQRTCFILSRAPPRTSSPQRKPTRHRCHLNSDCSPARAGIPFFFVVFYILHALTHSTLQYLNGNLPECSAGGRICQCTIQNGNMMLLPTGRKVSLTVHRIGKGPVFIVIYVLLFNTE